MREYNEMIYQRFNAKTTGIRFGSEISETYVRMHWQTVNNEWMQLAKSE